MDEVAQDSQISGLGKRAVSSALVLGGRRIIFQFLITGSNIILARLLFPEVFGVFIILSFILGVFGFFGDLGLAVALVQQKEDPSDKQLQGAFTVQIILGVFITLLVWLIAPALIGFYGTQLPSKSVLMLRILALSLLFGAPGVISKALLERKLEYGRYAVAEFVVLVVGKGLAILFAVQGMGVAALVYAELFSRLSGSVVTYMLKPWSLGVSFDFRRLSSMTAFGLPYQASAIVGLLNGAVIPFYIGAFPGPGGWTGAQAVGFVAFASGLAGFTKFFSEIIGQLIFPVISRAQEKRQKVREAIERALEISALTSFGLIAVVFALSREITYIVYTEKWLPAVPLLGLLLIQAAEVSLGLLLMNALLALGESKTYLKLSVFWAFLQWILTVPLVMRFGFVGLGWASVMVSATSVALPLFVLRERFELNFLKKTLPYAGIAVITFLVSYFVKRFIVVESLWQLLLVGVIGIGAYGSLALVVARRALKNNISYLLSLIKGKVQ